MESAEMFSPVSVEFEGVNGDDSMLPLLEDDPLNVSNSKTTSNGNNVQRQRITQSNGHLGYPREQSHQTTIAGSSSQLCESDVLNQSDEDRRNHGDSRGPLPFHCHGDKEAKPDKVARNQLIAVCALCFAFMIGESVGGYLANSLALFTDVLHLGSDLVGFLISLLAIYLSTKPASKKMSFGYHRAEVLGALFSVFFIWLVSGVLCYIAVERIIHEHYKDVKADEMLVTAGLGVVFNIVMGIVLQSDRCCKSATSHTSFGHSHGGHGHSHGGRGHSHERHRHNDATLLPLDDESEEESTHHTAERKRHKNINVRAAFIHVIGDIIQSLGVFTAALIIKCTADDRYRLADPICTFLFSILVLVTTITILRDTLRVILEGVPSELKYMEILKDLESIDGVEMAHGLHLWSLTIDKNAIAVHLAIDSNADFERVLSISSTKLRNQYNFYHCTVQVERYNHELMSTCNRCQGGPQRI
ncbi:proton-coupled zinc antiporter SLC30A2-like [Liolophura sinensis]|uniref:proton-coupled zinc antiporter SLC30A2-like n=1 Tax=Liolophura sinensis TaxID=3198878 RepID=UPI003158CB0E